MNKNPDNEIKVEVFENSRVPIAIATSSLVYGNGIGKRSPGNPVLSVSYLVNKHLDSPFGPSLYLYKSEKETISGHIFLQQRIYLSRNVPIEFLLASDLVSKSNQPFGGLKLFKRAVLASKEMDQSMINLSNRESSKIYSSFLKMKPIIQLEYRTSIINFSSIFSQIGLKFPSLAIGVFSKITALLLGRNLGFRLVERYGDEIDSFLCRELSETDLIGKRNSAILNWRFHASNEQKYVKFEVTCKNQIIGYFVFNLTSHKGKNIIVLMDFFLSQPTRRIGLAAINAASKAYPGANLLLITLNMNSILASKTFKTNTLKVPKVFIPQEIPFYITEHSSCFAPLFPSTHLTLFDTDIL